jgi:hypothetical protein
MIVYPETKAANPTDKVKPPSGKSLDLYRRKFFCDLWHSLPTSLPSKRKQFIAYHYDKLQARYR